MIFYLFQLSASALRPDKRGKVETFLVCSFKIYMYRNNNTLICFSFFNMVSVIVNCHLQGCSKPKRGFFLVVGGGGEGAELRVRKRHTILHCVGASGSPPGKFLNLS